MTVVILGLLFGQTLGCGREEELQRLEASQWTYRVVHRYPHDPDAFTQGLLYSGGVLFESTGLKGESSLRRVDLESGRVLQRKSNRADVFAEGLALWGDRLIQLTLERHVVYFYDPESLKLLSTRAYPFEGWGLTHDGKSLIASDGSSVLRFLDPQSLEIRRQIQVHDGSRQVDNLNELEYVCGLVWANVYLTDLIAVIDPTDGAVRAWLKLTELLPEAARDDAGVLNGIAYDADGGRLFVTGKRWPVLIEIEIPERGICPPPVAGGGGFG